MCQSPPHTAYCMEQPGGERACIDYGENILYSVQPTQLYKAALVETMPHAVHLPVSLSLSLPI